MAEGLWVRTAASASTRSGRVFSPHLDPSSARFQLAAPAGDLAAMAEEAAHLALGRHSIVRRCTSRSPAAGLPQLSVHLASGARRSAGPGEPRPMKDLVGMGVSDDPWESWIKATVEAVERYALSARHDPSTMLRAPYREVAESALPLRRFALFSDHQYGSFPRMRLPSDDDEIDWTWAYSLTRDRFALVPAALAYATVSRRPPNNFSESLISTGMACHVSVRAAVLAGLLEVVERDAVMVSWLNRRAATPARPRPGTDLAGFVGEHFDLPDLDFVLIDLTVDTAIPVVGCLAFSRDPALPAATFGSAARTDPAEAARKALFEAAQILYVTHGFGWSARDEMAEADVHTIADHARYYSGASAASKLRALVSPDEEMWVDEIGGAGCVSGAAGGDDLEACVQALDAVGLEVLVVEVTTEDVARCGFRAVRVLVPGAVDINGDVRYPRLGSHRIRAVPDALGWPAVPYERLNLGACPLA